MKNLIYIQVHEGHFKIRTFQKSLDRTITCSGLSHPRTLAGKFSDVEASFKVAVNQEPKVLLGFLKPKMLVHLVPEMKGGYTELELRFFREAALGAGSSATYMLTNEYGPLSDAEIFTIAKKL